MQLTGFIVIVLGVVIVYLAFRGKLHDTGSLLYQIATRNTLAAEKQKSNGQ